MPGISFLFKKGFHPQTLDNQKKLFIAEEAKAERERRERERAEEVKKEQDLADYRRAQPGKVDPRDSSLKFMYNDPQAGKKDNQSKDTKVGKHFEPVVGEDGDDDMVRAFKQKLKRKAEGSAGGAAGSTAATTLTAERAEEDEPPSVALPTDSEDGGQVKKIKKDENFGASAHRSKLEQMTGKRNHVGLSQEEMGERFSFLKNAPLEGTFARNIQLQHKPFNEVIRNVQCLRCGEWGHQSGDRECPMRDNNPHDLARQRREDPLTYMKSDNFLAEKQKVALRHAHSSLAKPSSQSRGGVASSSSNGENRKHTQSSRDDDNAEDVESDPEAEFIATLSKREKKLLLMRLEALENGLPPPPIPDTSSSESSSESEGDDDSLSSVSIDNDVFGPQLQNKSHRHRNKKSKKSKKSKTKKERKEKKEKNNTKHRHKD